MPFQIINLATGDKECWYLHFIVLSCTGLRPTGKEEEEEWCDCTDRGKASVVGKNMKQGSVFALTYLVLIIDTFTVVIIWSIYSFEMGTF